MHKRLVVYFSLAMWVMTFDSLQANATILPKALEIEMNGQGSRVDAEAYGQLLRMIGDMVAEGMLNKFSVIADRNESSVQICIEISQNAYDAAIYDGEFAPQLLQERLMQIVPAPPTLYSVNMRITCDGS